MKQFTLIIYNNHRTKTRFGHFIRLPSALEKNAENNTTKVGVWKEKKMGTNKIFKSN